MSWFSSDHTTGLDDIRDIGDPFNHSPDDEKVFVDVALHVGTHDVIRIILASGGWYSVKDATAIRDSLTRTIEAAYRGQISDLEMELRDR